MIITFGKNISKALIIDLDLKDPNHRPFKRNTRPHAYDIDPPSGVWMSNWEIKRSHQQAKKDGFIVIYLSVYNDFPSLLRILSGFRKSHPHEEAIDQGGPILLGTLPEEIIQHLTSRLTMPMYSSSFRV